MSIDLEQVLKIVAILVGCWVFGYFWGMTRIYLIKVMEKV